MRRIALVNQKGGVGKTTTAANLGAALAYAGRRVLLVDLDPQGNLSTHLSVEVPPGHPSTYSVLCEGMPLSAAMVPTAIANLSIVGTNIDLSGAEMELAAAIGRESILNDAVDDYIKSATDEERFDYLIFDCPPSLGLLSVNGLVAAREVFIALQTEFFALQGMSKLVEIVQLLKRRLNPELEISGIIPCLYDSRLRLAREVLAEIRRYFPGPVFRRSIRANVKLAEAPSYGQSIFEYAPSSPGASDYAELAQEVIAQEAPGSVPERAQAPAEKAAVPAQFQNASATSEDDVDDVVINEVEDTVDDTSEGRAESAPSANTQADRPTSIDASDSANTKALDQPKESTSDSVAEPDALSEASKNEDANRPSKELNAFAAQLASDAPSDSKNEAKVDAQNEVRHSSVDAVEEELAALSRRPIPDERKTDVRTQSAPANTEPKASVQDRSLQATSERDVLQPIPPPTSMPPTSSAPLERPIMRADDLPPLPEDAFRICER